MTPWRHRWLSSSRRWHSQDLRIDANLSITTTPIRSRVRRNLSSEDVERMSVVSFEHWNITAERQTYVGCAAIFGIPGRLSTYSSAAVGSSGWSARRYLGDISYALGCLKSSSFFLPPFFFGARLSLRSIMSPEISSYFIGASLPIMPAIELLALRYSPNVSCQSSNVARTLRGSRTTSVNAVAIVACVGWEVGTEFVSDQGRVIVGSVLCLTMDEVAARDDFYECIGCQKLRVDTIEGCVVWIVSLGDNAASTQLRSIVSSINALAGGPAYPVFPVFARQ